MGYDVHGTDTSHMHVLKGMKQMIDRARRAPTLWSLRPQDPLRKRAAPSLQEVARRAGVLPASVSRVLNGIRPTSERLRRAVGAAVKEVGYVPKSSRPADSHQIIVVFTADLLNPYFLLQRDHHRCRGPSLRAGGDHPPGRPPTRAGAVGHGARGRQSGWSRAGLKILGGGVGRSPRSPSG